MDCHGFSRADAGLGHADLIELHGDCSVCHATRSVSAVYHDQCTRCHLAHDAARFENADGTVACGWCHLR